MTCAFARWPTPMTAGELLCAILLVNEFTFTSRTRTTVKETYRAARAEHRGRRPTAVRRHHRLPLPLRPHDDLAVSADRVPADRLGAYRKGHVPQGHQVLGQALPDQHRHGRGDGHRPGVPVRDELVGLLALRRRHLRRPARLRGAD